MSEVAGIYDQLSSIIANLDVADLWMHGGEDGAGLRRRTNAKSSIGEALP
jgi:hypothetical protein